ncbi:hypothetical protein BC936DRAFT_138851 [Jimgerdemannia flammicorona]|uniref:Uncharacterized protein n=1 Tax=Jimgerdemannia flammicorona TaxID=994334 RepID=A0A433BG80_9FUNG|nr:hypothetical protein BC936DRAFT_138851 [Jimgerdemannia flammicorona]
MWQCRHPRVAIAASARPPGDGGGHFSDAAGAGAEELAVDLPVHSDVCGSGHVVSRVAPADGVKLRLHCGVLLGDPRPAQAASGAVRPAAPLGETGRPVEREPDRWRSRRRRGPELERLGRLHVLEWLRGREECRNDLSGRLRRPQGRGPQRYRGRAGGTVLVGPG